MGTLSPENHHRGGSIALASVAFRTAFAIICSSPAYATQFAYIPCDDGTVRVINVATHSVVKTLSVGGGPVGVAVNPALHQVLVTNSNDNTVSVINTGTESVKNPPIDLVKGGPEGVAVSPDGSLVYVTKNTDDSVSVINAATGGLITTIGVGFLPLGVVVSPDGAKVYVANNGGTNTIQVIDVATNAIVPPDIQIGGVPGAGPAGLAIKPDGTTLYATKLAGNIVAVIDIATRIVTHRIGVGTFPEGIAISPDGKRLYVANFGDGSLARDTVSVIDTATNKEFKTIPVGQGPVGLDIGHGGGKVFVANNTSNDVSVIDTASNMVIDTIHQVCLGPEAFGTFIREGSNAHPVHQHGP